MVHKFHRLVFGKKFPTSGFEVSLLERNVDNFL
ncbi:uncharacterized protein METZ01_LOCUS290812 [marine metagenome]|uniref:Uncharacterized protein n=1 Tax=marine metagenome TaxID=408172 RepID=A0A382LMH4_9ZZZZ